MLLELGLDGQGQDRNRMGYNTLKRVLFNQRYDTNIAIRFSPLVGKLRLISSWPLKICFMPEDRNSCVYYCLLISKPYKRNRLHRMIN